MTRVKIFRKQPVRHKSRCRITKGCLKLLGRAPKSRLQIWIIRYLPSEQDKWRMFIRKCMSNPACLQPGDVMTASIRAGDSAIDLGEQHNRIVAA